MAIGSAITFGSPLLMEYLHCYKCGHNWLPRKRGRPFLCPHCNFPAWDDPKAVPNPIFRTVPAPDDPAIPPKETEPSKELPTVPGLESVSAEEVRCIILLLTILRSHHPVAEPAIRTNLLGFHELVERAAGTYTGPSHSDKEALQIALGALRKAKGLDRAKDDTGSPGGGMGKGPRRDDPGTRGA